MAGLVHAVNTEHNAGLRVEDINEWELKNILDPILGESWWAWMQRRDWLWATFPAVPGAIGGIETLRRDGNYVEILTSKPRWAEPQVFRWLGKWRPPVNRVTIIGPQDKKSEFTNATVLVDDKPENCMEFYNKDEKHGNRDAVLFKRPHNRVTAEAWGYGIIPVASNWRELLEVLKRFPDYGGKDVV